MGCKEEGEMIWIGLLVYGLLLGMSISMVRVGAYADRVAEQVGL
jgi:hypothetical protein